MNEIVLDYEPRAPFIEFHQRQTRWAAMCCHRRAGKTVACIHDLVLRALYTKKKHAKYAYVGPFRQQAKEIAWEYLKNATEKMRKGPPRESELKVTLHNGASIQIYGADNAQALRGLYFDGAILDEYGDCRPSIWGEIILPTLMDRGGWAVFIGTMKGRNHFYRTLERATQTDGWFHMVLKGSESGILKQEDLEELKRQLTEEQYQQEIECNPDAAVMGTYYSDLISKAEIDGRVGEFPYNPKLLVHASADLGFSDSTAFWFWQVDELGPYLIDYYENDGKPLQHYTEMLIGKGYEYADVWLPHDAVAKTLQTGRSTIEQMQQSGLPCKPVPRLAVQHGIDAGRLLLQKVRIDQQGCYQGIEALRAYRRAYNEKTQQFSSAPLHDWSSNGSDAFRYFALVTEEGKSMQPVDDEEGPQYRSIGGQQGAVGYCLEDLWEDKAKNNWRHKVLRI